MLERKMIKYAKLLTKHTAIGAKIAANKTKIKSLEKQSIKVSNDQALLLRQIAILKNYSS